MSAEATCDAVVARRTDNEDDQLDEETVDAHLRFWDGDTQYIVYGDFSDADHAEKEAARQAVLPQTDAVVIDRDRLQLDDPEQRVIAAFE
jgi:hypothetical protein